MRYNHSDSHVTRNVQHAAKNMNHSVTSVIVLVADALLSVSVPLVQV